MGEQPEGPISSLVPVRRRLVTRTAFFVVMRDELQRWGLFPRLHQRVRNALAGDGSEILLESSSEG